MTMLYYMPPSDECFYDLKDKSIRLWQTYDDGFKYATGKINAIKDIQNVGDNFMYMFAIFDINNQRKIGTMISLETKAEINNRLLDGGSPEYLLL